MNGVERNCGGLAVSVDSLWRQYSADFQESAPLDLRQQISNLNEPFVCPLCLYAFDCVNANLDKVTKEHVLPSSIGGKLITLTCKDCNNRSGSKLESHLVQRVRVKSRKRPVSATVDFGSAKFKAEMHVPKSDAETIKIAGIGKQSDPRQIKEAIRLLNDEKWHGREFKLDVSLGYKKLNSDVALVRMAYLFMFRTFGYRYVFNESATVIREQVSDVSNESPVLKGVKWFEGMSIPVNPCFAVAVEPPELYSSIGVFFDLDPEVGQVAVVTLPPLNSDGASFYEMLSQFEHSGKVKYKYP